MRPTAPDFQMITAAGEELDSSHLVGHEAVLVFMSVSCQPCLESVATVYDLADSDERPGRRFFLLVDSNGSAIGDKFGTGANNLQVCFPARQASSPFDTLGIAAMPAFLVIDEDGRLGPSGPLSDLKHALARR